MNDVTAHEFAILRFTFELTHIYPVLQFILILKPIFFYINFHWDFTHYNTMYHKKWSTSLMSTSCTMVNDKVEREHYSNTKS